MIPFDSSSLPLFISVYPVFLLHNKSRLRQWPAEIQHMYFTITGIFIAYWTLGGKFKMIHQNEHHLLPFW